jgi:hypothetical protein
VTSEDIQDAEFLLLRLGERERRRPQFEESLFPRMTQQEIHPCHLARYQQDHDAAALKERMRDVMSREIDEWMVTRSGPEEAETTFSAELASCGSPAEVRMTACHHIKARVMLLDCNENLKRAFSARTRPIRIPTSSKTDICKRSVNKTKRSRTYTRVRLME